MSSPVPTKVMCTSLKVTLARIDINLAFLAFPLPEHRAFLPINLKARTPQAE